MALDTGSYRSGRISAAAFVDDALAGFFCAERVEGNPVIRRFDARTETQSPTGAEVTAR